jgi:hypothetical protein
LTEFRHFLEGVHRGGAHGVGAINVASSRLLKSLARKAAIITVEWVRSSLRRPIRFTKNGALSRSAKAKSATLSHFSQKTGSPLQQSLLTSVTHLDAATVTMSLECRHPGANLEVKSFI